jgi:hypothetical protein
MILLGVVWALPASGATRYVNLNNPSPAPPYTNWATAATSIQDAIAPAVPGDLILVAAGTYASGSQANGGLNRVNISKPITVRSASGPAATVIAGYQAPGNQSDSIRCAYVTNGAVLSGFTLTGGGTETSDTGGGAKCASTNAFITNCVITANQAGAGGGGVFSGTVIGCTISGNSTLVHGGGGAASSIVKNSVLSANVARSLATGTGGAAYEGSLTNCLIVGNTGATAGGASYSSTLINCTVVGNVTYGADGPVSGGAAKNSIVYYNYARTNVAAAGSGGFTNCCVFPVPARGANNLTNPPLFLNQAAGNYRLNAGSACINAGNNSYVASTTDLDGKLRVFNLRVDLGAYEFQSVVHYVRTNKHTPVFPYADWASSATNIQDALDAAAAGDYVVVSNGVYKTGGRAIYGAATNRVAVERAIVLQSLSGAAVTTIVGAVATNAALPAGIRCVYLASGAALNGFTLTNGGARASGDLVMEQSGGGIWCEDNSACVSNCVITGNFAAQQGGGAFRGCLVNCVLTNNTAGSGGGGASNVFLNCRLALNSVSYNAVNGGGAYCARLTNCVVVGNRAPGNSSVGGGTYDSLLFGCGVSNNVAGNGGGISYGGAWNSLISSNRAVTAGGGAFLCLLNNCILKYNLAGNGGGARGGTANNCTVTANTALASGGGAADANLNNSIIQFNSAPVSTNVAMGALSYCCTTPLPSSGWGNITNNPGFANAAGGDFHLQGASACINSGNNATVATAYDFGGLPRIVGGTVDIGAYEYQAPTSVISYAYLQQYGLPSDGSADYADTDGDHANNWAEWQAGTDPTDAASALRLISVVPGPAGTSVRWQSVDTRPYFVQRATNSAAGAFRTVATNIPGQEEFTTWLDKNATGTGRVFYRVGVP